MTHRKSQILKIAAQLFKERGYSAVTMRDLANAMGMKAASLYNHISGKQEILSLLILKVAKEFTLGMDRVKSDQKFAGPSSAKQAEQLIALHIRIAITYTNELAVLNNDWMHLEGREYELYMEMRKQYEQDFREILNAGIQHGEFQEMNVETLLYSLLSTLRSLYLFIPKRSEEEIQGMEQELPQLLLLGLVKR
ncbi:TetR/AcrR family transcriptional regulator [Nonlabens xiamenensis]|uniref:TetR/AcrR family transcriptional regulator n=1 Tax=Nonlabens xiamenensis TaxID=2341043 RepID=UPI000F6127EB|nr:TetR/AcrR family transcriptional regulator [Nonlabens xiamenensis]